MKILNMILGLIFTAGVASAEVIVVDGTTYAMTDVGIEAAKGS